MDRTQHEDEMVSDLDAPPLSLSLDAIFRDHRRYDDLVRRCQGEAPVPTAIVFPTDVTALRGAVETAHVGVTRPILVGPSTVMRAAAEAAGLDISGFELLEAADEAAAAAAGARLVAEGTAGMLMKGSLHTAALLHAVLAHDGALRGSRRLSHVFAFDIPAYPKPLLVTDAVVNISPTLANKVDICQNAIDLAHRLGIACPKVAVLSAIETVDPAILSTIDAAALCKMADRGQITGGILDGPLALDDAISPAAAAAKHIESAVAGDADVLVVPDVEAGNILYKELTYLAGADAAGVVLGAAVPIVLASRADTVRTRIASAALGALLTRASRT